MHRVSNSKLIHSHCKGLKPLYVHLHITILFLQTTLIFFQHFQDRTSGEIGRLATKEWLYITHYQLTNAYPIHKFVLHLWRSHLDRIDHPCRINLDISCRRSRPSNSSIDLEEVSITDSSIQGDSLFDFSYSTCFLSYLFHIKKYPATPIIPIKPFSSECDYVWKYSR